jgi:predicted dehydrogenase
MKKIRVGIIGTGFMGREHTKAYKNVTNIFGDEVVPELVVVADIVEGAAKKFAEQYGYTRWTTDWKSVVSDPEVDLVDICVPNVYHCPIAIEAAKNKKDILCEKPLAMSAAEAIEAVRIVEREGIITAMGFNYLRNPIQTYVKELIASGKMGRVLNFRGTFDQDFYNDPEQKHEWRMLKKESASGALGDLASHTISMSQYLVGDIAEVCGMTQIVVHEYPDPKNPSRMLPVENDDIVQFLFTYENGAMGAIFSNRLASGRKVALGYEIQMTNGSIVYTQERQSEVQIYHHDDDKRDRGFKTVLIAPGHGDYGKFYGGAGICLGYADQKTIEEYHVLKSVAERKPEEIDFRFGAKVMQVIDAVLESAATRKWVAIKSIK